jgi:hypothetical protein
MDRKTTLLNKLRRFKRECETRNRTLADMCLEEAFPGDNSTSFVLKVKADWLDNLSLSEGLDILIDILWDTTSIATRTEIFSICVVNSADEFDCKNVSFTENSLVNVTQTDTLALA